jgi:hypothetical protein
MPDGFNGLFPDAGPAAPPREGFATGRARRRERAPSPVLQVLAGIRALIDTQFTNLRLLLRSLEQEQRRLAKRQAEQAEALDRLCTRIVQIERAVSLRPPPEVPVPRRRKPTG